jgi:hypothetical protein
MKIIMISYILKKTFLEYWDNLYNSFFINICFILIIGMNIYLPELFDFNKYASLLSIIIGLYIFNLFIGFSSSIAKEISDYKIPNWKLFFLNLKKVWKDGILFTTSIILQFIIMTFVIPYCLKLNNKILGLSLVSIIFLTCITWWFSMTYYYPVKFRLNLKCFKIINKSLLFFLDNLFLTVFILFFSFILLVISFLTAMILPGISFILIFHQITFKIMIYKYEYLKNNPNSIKKYIPWNNLLKNEIKIVGKRTFKEIIFPWKQ